jgi:hypothetical protein
VAAASKVAGLDCGDTLDENSRRILSARLQDTLALQRRITGPDDSVGLHDLRIAAKRLRYTLDMFTLCFPSGQAHTFADRVRAVQDVLGRLHDLDVFHDLLVEQLHQHEGKALEHILDIAQGVNPEDNGEHIRAAIVDAEALNSRVGLLKVVSAKLQERRQQYDAYENLWREWQETGFIQQLTDMIEGRPEAVTV